MAELVRTVVPPQEHVSTPVDIYGLSLTIAFVLATRQLDVSTKGADGVEEALKHLAAMLAEKTRFKLHLELLKKSQAQRNKEYEKAKRNAASFASVPDLQKEYRDKSDKEIKDVEHHLRKLHSMEQNAITFFINCLTSFPNQTGLQAHALAQSQASTEEFEAALAALTKTVEQQQESLKRQEEGWKEHGEAVANQIAQAEENLKSRDETTKDMFAKLEAKFEARFQQLEEGKKQELEAQNRKFEEVQAKSQAMEIAFSNLSQKCQTLEQALSRQAKTLEESAQIVASHTKILDDHSNSLAEHSGEFNTHSEKLAAHTQTLTAQEGALSQQRQALAQQSEAQANQSQELANQVQKLDTVAESWRNELDMRLVTITNTWQHQLERRLEKSNASLLHQQNLTGDMFDIRTGLMTVIDKVNKMETRFSGIDDTLGSVGNKTNKMEERLSNIDVDTLDAMGDITVQFPNLEEKVKGLEGNVKALEGNVKNLQTEVSKVQRQRFESPTMVTTPTNVEAPLAGSAGVSKQVFSATMQAITAKFGDLINAVKNDFTALEDRVQSLEAKAPLKQETLDNPDMRSDIARLDLALTNLRSEATHNKVQINSLTETANKLAKNHQVVEDTLKSNIGSLTMSISTLDDRFNNLTTKSLFDHMVSYISTLYPEPAQIKTDIRHLFDLVKTLQAGLQDCQGKVEKVDDMAKALDSDYHTNVKKRRIDSSPNMAGLNGVPKGVAS